MITATERSEQRMWDALEKHFSRRSERERFSALVALRERFLQHDVPANYLNDDAACAAYEAWFFPQSFAKATSILQEMDLPRAQRIVDLGSAMGPFGFAALKKFPDAELRLVDRTEGALKSAKQLAALLGAKIETEHASLETADVSRADLVLCGNALLELPEPSVAAILSQMSAKAHLVIVEPGDRLHARKLQALRDHLLADDSLRRAPLLPCPHSSPCPASVRPRDFCHQARALELPAFWHALREELGVTDARMRFSYLVYGPERPRVSELVRIISHRLVEKGRIRYFGCSAEGAVEIMRQDRLRSAQNAAFDTLGRGALVKLPRQSARVKLGEEDAIEVVGAADPWDAER